MSLNTKRLLNALGIAFDENQDEVQARLDLLSTEEKQDLLLAKDFATQTTLATLLTKAAYEAKVDLTLTALRDALRGASDKTLSDIATALSTLATAAKQDALAELFGEKQDSPTTYSLLARLKALETELAAIKSTDGIKKIVDPLPTGENNIGFVTLSGSKLEEQKTQADAVSDVVTFTENLATVEICNTDTINDGVFTVNGVAIAVPKGTSFKAVIGGTPGATVAITGATTYTVRRYV